MRLIDFMREFPDEQRCERKLKEYCGAQGIVCPHCGCTGANFRCATGLLRCIC